MKENDIQKTFDKITLSEEKKNLIVNSIIQKREVRTGKKVNYTLWKQALQVCLLIVLCVMVVFTPVLLKPAQDTQGNSNFAGLTGGENTDSSAAATESSEISDTSSVAIIDSDIPDVITYEYIIDKMTDDNIYYNTLSGTLVSNYLKSIPSQSSTTVIQYNNRTSEYYEARFDNTGSNLELFSDGKKSVFYNNARKTYRVYDFPLFNIKDMSEYSKLEDNGTLAGIVWLRAPKILKEAYGNYNREITITEYLGRKCAVLTKSLNLLDPNASTENGLVYINGTMYEYVDVLTGVILYYEVKAEAGEIFESVKFTEVKFNEDLKVKTIADEGDKYNDYRELMVIKTEAENRATATQTIGNLQITMEFDKYRIAKGDTLTVKTTVKNVGSEPVTLWAPTSAYKIQGSVSLSTYCDGVEFKFGHVVDDCPVTDDIYTGELQPGESFTREDVYDTNKADEKDTDGTLEVRAKIFIFGDDYTSETVKVEVCYIPFYFVNTRHLSDNS